MAVFALALALGACADAPAPFEPQAAAVPEARLEGSYVLAARQAVSAGELYAAEVHFGVGGAADGRTYLVQVGVSRGGHAAVTLLQQGYTLRADTVVFAGALLERGVLSADARLLRTSVRVDGAAVPVTLERR